MKSHTAKNVEAQVKAAAPELTQLAKHRVALAYAIASGNKTASTSTARRRMVEAFLTMPTFALQTLYDMHSAANHSAADEAAPTDGEEVPPAPPVEGEEGAPAPGGGAEAGLEGSPEGDLGGDLGGMDLGGGAGGGGGMGAGAPAEGAPETGELKAENEALIGDIQKLESDFESLQEVLPSGSALDLSSLLASDAMEDKSAQLPAGAGAGEGAEDPGLNLTPEGSGAPDNVRPFNPMEAAGGEAKAASRFGAEDTQDDFEMALLSSLQGVDSGEQKSDPALPEEVSPIFNQVDVEEPDFIDLPENILSDLAPAAGVSGGGPAMPRAAARKTASVAPVSAGARFLPSGTVKPASSEDTQVSHLASLLNDTWNQ